MDLVHPIEYREHLVKSNSIGCRPLTSLTHLRALFGEAYTGRVPEIQAPTADRGQSGRRCDLSSRAIYRYATVDAARGQDLAFGETNVKLVWRPVESAHTLSDSSQHEEDVELAWKKHKPGENLQQSSEL